MKLSEIKGERALEVVADLIDPVSRLVKDEIFKKLIDEDKPAAIKHLLKNHKKDVIAVLAILNDEDPDTYEPTLLSLPKMLMNLLDDPDVMSLFESQSQSDQLASSGSATENTEAVKA